LIVNANELVKLLGIEDFFQKKAKLADIFANPVKIWLEKASDELEKWIQEALKRDEWEVISETEPYSSSVVDTFSMFFEVIEYLGNFYFLETQADGTCIQIFTIPLAKTIQLSLFFFTKHIHQKAQSKIDEMQKKGVGGWSKRKITINEVKLINEKLTKLKRLYSMKKRDALTGLRKKVPGRAASIRKIEKKSQKGNKISKNLEDLEEREFNDDVYLLCVLTNDLETCRMLLSDIISHFESSYNETRGAAFVNQVQTIFTQIKEMIEALLSNIVDSLHSTLFGFLIDSFNSNFEQGATDALFCFLNFQLTPFADTLYPQVMDKYLRKVCYVLCDKTLELRVEKKITERNEKYEGFVKAFVSFFNADGDGLPISFLNTLKAQLSSYPKF